MATALMAIARKVIILDLEKSEPEYLWGIASVVIAISVGYWLVVQLPRFDLELGPGKREKKQQISDVITDQDESHIETKHLDVTKNGESKAE